MYLDKKILYFIFTITTIKQWLQGCLTLHVGAPGVVITTLLFLPNFQIGPISWNVCHWQAITAKCDVTL
jgi:hypothetical protein